MKNFLSCLMLVALWILGSSSASAQSYGEQKTLQLNATVNPSSTTITISWDAYASVDSIDIFRMSSGTWPSTPLASLSGSATSYVDATVSANQRYEYKVVGYRSSGYDAYGYIISGITVDEITDRGLIAIIIDSSLLGDLTNEIDQYSKDLIGDGYQVLIEPFDTSLAADVLKDTINSIYTNYSNLTSVFLIGALPYYYTGAMSPDGHSDHHGAWPSDLVLADVDGSYSDINVNYTNTTYSRLSNSTSDEKLDQSYLSTNAEIQIGRLDLSRLTAFSQSEVVLYKNYFNKLHAFKTGEFTPRAIGIIDDNFTAYTEGFSQNGYRNFSPLVGNDSVYNADILTTLSGDGALWSFATGAGSFTSISGFATTNQLSNNSYNGAFSLVMGSYNADPDQENNLMRAMLANGNFLTTGWAGRPNWFVHHMGMGLPIGYSTLVTQNNTNSLYSPSGYYARMMHIMLLGDPSLKLHYTENISNLYTIRSQYKDTAFLTWTNPSSTHLGINIYRSKDEYSGYVKLNSSPITAAYYNDVVSPDTSYFYRIETVELVVNNSGSYYESSIGEYIESDKNAAPLPVTLLSFDAYKNLEKVELEWTVADEINFSHYEVEKYNETDNQWYKIASINAKGLSNEISHYSHTDNKAIIGKNIYRLKMVDFDNSFEYSPLRVVLFEDGIKYGDFQVTPTLAKDHLNIDCQLLGYDHNREFTITNLSGLEVHSGIISKTNKRIDISALPQGVYFISANDNKGLTKKIIKTN